MKIFLSGSMGKGIFRELKTRVKSIEIMLSFWDSKNKPSKQFKRLSKTKKASRKA